MKLAAWCATGLSRLSTVFEGARFAYRESETLEYSRERGQLERFDEVNLEPTASASDLRPSNPVNATAGIVLTGDDSPRTWRMNHKPSSPGIPKSEIIRSG
jgi:hypothetical protein